MCCYSSDGAVNNKRECVFEPAQKTASLQDLLLRVPLLPPYCTHYRTAGSVACRCALVLLTPLSSLGRVCLSVVRALSRRLAFVRVLRVRVRVRYVSKCWWQVRFRALFNFNVGFASSENPLAPLSELLLLSQ